MAGWGKRAGKRVPCLQLILLLLILICLLLGSLCLLLLLLQPGRAGKSAQTPVSSRAAKLGRQQRSRLNQQAGSTDASWRPYWHNSQPREACPQHPKPAGRTEVRRRSANTTLTESPTVHKECGAPWIRTTIHLGSLVLAHAVQELNEVVLGPPGAVDDDCRRVGRQAGGRAGLWSSTPGQQAEPPEPCTLPKPKGPTLCGLRRRSQGSEGALSH